MVVLGRGELIRESEPLCAAQPLPLGEVARLGVTERATEVLGRWKLIRESEPPCAALFICTREILRTVCSGAESGGRTGFEEIDHRTGI